jgi:UDP-N-acetylglucosamine diphosphorylase/glucosamine-1-phosphate N-acetyltransferase
MSNVMAIILAAGKGTRFNSDLPKVLHPIHKKPMIHHVIESVRQCGITNTCLVVGYQKESVLCACESYGISHATQMEQLGTGHAVVCALDEIKKTNPEHCLILAGDCPLIRSETLKNLIETHTVTQAAATILTATLADAGNYGRIIRDQHNHILAIKEAKDCTPNERLIQEFNSGIYCFKTDELLKSIAHIQTNNAQNEYYLTDMIEILRNQSLTISGHCIENAIEVSGANTQDELATLEQNSH